MRALLPALALVLTALSACSAEAEEAPEQSANPVQREDATAAEWRADLAAELGTDAFDFLALQQAAAVDCQRTDAGAWAVELALSGDVSTSALTRIGLEHACADVVAAFDEGLAAVEQAGDPLDLVCGPGVRLSSQDRLRADLVCAQR
ncbi:hypothetical protein ASG76_07780 [Nocardioides sp. Soil774]|uniref:hypothetical protein n=1 Tax=Nocardioides sp. Soil774 TaxID=1736408 RepID=UPI0006FB468E|nr:hypothetical protein [Nocardioides sp. Soil774]KRE95528.1 hypothetical protein ASG76_07780 [Nocardioides sp. Soil774]